MATNKAYKIRTTAIQRVRNKHGKTRENETFSHAVMKRIFMRKETEQL
jgi:hypothetical protein